MNDPSALLSSPSHWRAIADESDADAGSTMQAYAVSFPLGPCERQVLQLELNQAPIVLGMGLRLDLSDAAYVRVVLDAVSSAHLGGMGTDAVSGMLISAMMDCAMSAAGLVHFPLQRSGTIEVTTHFARPAFGDSLAVVCGVSRKTKNLAFCDARLTNHRGTVCAFGRGIVAATTSMLRKEPA
jgi:acyl-coenzyme A thioesterase PaaI-like protein